MSWRIRPLNEQLRNEQRRLPITKGQFSALSSSGKTFEWARMTLASVGERAPSPFRWDELSQYQASVLMKTLRGEKA